MTEDGVESMVGKAKTCAVDGVEDVEDVVNQFQRQICDGDARRSRPGRVVISDAGNRSRATESGGWHFARRTTRVYAFDFGRHVRLLCAVYDKFSSDVDVFKKTKLI